MIYCKIKITLLHIACVKRFLSSAFQKMTIPNPMNMNTLLILFFSLFLTQCNGDEPNQTNENNVQEAKQTDGNTEYFLGTMAYKAHATGSDADGAEMFNEGAANTIKCYWGELGFRQDETGGWNEGSVITRFDKKESYFLSHEKKEAYKASVVNLADMDEDTKAFMVKIFTYEIAPTGEQETIAGYVCDIYDVKKSGFIKEGAKVKVWIAKGLQLRPSQYDFQTEWKRVISILPLSYGFKEGAVMKSETLEGEVFVTYEVVSVEPGSPGVEVFSVPEGYAVTKED
jgi:uncharacterized protein DUF4412